ncbi:type I polyketide synthase [Streptomyces sp. MUM 16J]|uniref:type I polyketide synthase n=1 Tax=Streptomyces sp. MUM 16J TaxID=2791988 RepID=UPI001F03C8A1|nr:type I polyketide synthase [Streptomyces sp. MUM 16J]MCH0560976.1 SDR family NAD(P)-dependent oxidoreductase [Streptomyces sp. MUM 16J]
MTSSSRTSPARIAVVGIACRYPDADTHEQLWQNVLAGRRAFRRLPDERMRAEDYYSPDPAAPDRFYSSKAAVLDGFEFDRVKYRVAGSTFRATDMTHWLALDTAAQALGDAGFPFGEGLGDLNTGVIIGNTLTGEFSRANLMRLRWPYVRRTVGAALREQGWDDAALAVFLEKLEERYKSPFPPIGEDTLAGGLANTIAGRICNHFDLKGGGFTVDGACSSSLLSVATACDALADGRLDVAVVGGVDLSIDPFEVIGFAKTGALATGEMRVYDRGSNGFWPGEGCGILVLMRDQDAVAQGRFRYASIAGWGYSSDGRGGITRPEAGGHRLALQRAYAAAGFGIETVGYFEGHGTGTAVGDAIELRAFSESRRAADPDAAPAAISTVKGNFGHTKAAAGVAGLIKAVLAVRHQVIPPATSHVDPHPELTGDRPALRVPSEAELWPKDAAIRAGVSSMGFGGINAHIVVEHADGVRKEAVGRVTRQLVRSRQDAELLLLDADTMAELRGKVTRLAAFVPRLSFAELGDLAATLQSELDGRPIRAAVVAATSEQADQRFTKLLTLLDGGARSALDIAGGVFLGSATPHARIGFLFPGQGSGRRGDGGAMRRRFASVDELYRAHPLPTDGDLVDTAVAQPRIVTSSLAALRVLSTLGIEAVAAAGHSLGEVTALHWAGATDEASVLRIAAERGRLMAEASESGGGMAGIAAPPADVEPLLAGEPVVVAGYNGPRQTVISGQADAVQRVCAAASAQGLGTALIHVSHAFHSEAVAPAAEAFGTYLGTQEFTPPARRVISAVTAGEVTADTDVPELLTRQVLEPVRFTEAVQALSTEVDLLLEVGPGKILQGLVADIAPGVPVVSLDADSTSLSGLLTATAAAYALGAGLRHAALFEDRFTRPLPLDKEFHFFASPCESTPEVDLPFADVRLDAPPVSVPANELPTAAAAGDGDSLSVLLRLAAERAELPLEAVNPHSNPLDELHLSSITVTQIMNRAAQELGITAPMVTTAFATSTLAELAELLDGLDETTHDDAAQPQVPLGVAPWVRAFAVDLVPAEPGPAAVPESAGDGDWELFAPARHPLAPALHEALRIGGLGGGVLLCLPTDCDENHTALMIAAARAALSRTGATRFVAIGDRRGAAGLAKTLHLERPGIATTVVTLPLPDRMPAERAGELSARIVTDVAATRGFSEVHYGADGRRTVPVLRALPLVSPAGARGATSGTEQVLDTEDVLLVTGGGKGITAECALALAAGTGAGVGLLGRSDPATDPELRANLDRMTAAGVNFRYVSADVTSADEVKAAVDEIRDALGPVTAVLHGAGRNEPHALANLDEASFRRTLATKITGLENVLIAVDPAALRLLVTFGSIIGRAGLSGEGDYATANDWLTDLTQRVQDDYPDCRCLALEWSVWSGSGMGERLGVLESLVRQGIEPIPTEEGVALLKQLLAEPQTPSALVVMGRAGGLPTLTLETTDLPLLRFVDRPQAHYPGVELVVDSDLSASGDPYLADHELDGDLLFPAVLGMEAMAQAATALTGFEGAPTLEDMEFLRPIVIPLHGRTTIRVAVLAENVGAVRAVIRSSETGFQADHFRATLRYDRPEPEDTGPAPVPDDAPRIPLDPARDLYGPVLFQGLRFQRLTGYRELAARECVAEISDAATLPWFARHLPAELVLADPGTRDALMHSIQCCVPDATLLPVSIERLHLSDPTAACDEKQVTLHARERSRTGDTYVYDLDVRDQSGLLVERWEGLVLQAVRKQDGTGPWRPALLGPYLERRAERLLPEAVRCVVRPDDEALAEGLAARRKSTAQAASWALGRRTVVAYRPDGRPEIAGGPQLSASHGAGVTFVVAGEVPVACDVQPAEPRSLEEWEGLLGPEGTALARLIATEQDEELSVAATRVWSAVECLRKNGRALAALTVDSTPGAEKHWVVLRSGAARIATFPTLLEGVGEPVVFALMAQTMERND